MLRSDWILLTIAVPVGGIAAAVYHPGTTLAASLLAFGVGLALRRRFSRRTLLIAGCILGAILASTPLGFLRTRAVADEAARVRHARLARVETAARELVQAAAGEQRLAALGRLAGPVAAAEGSVESRILDPYRIPSDLKAQLDHLAAWRKEDPCPVPAEPIFPTRPSDPALPEGATISIRGRFIRNQSTAIPSKREILVQDGERYFLVRNVDPEWFLPAGPNYVQLTKETASIDIADGRTALLVNVSDQKAFLATNRQQDALRGEADERYEAALDRWASAVRARRLALEGLDACRAAAAITTAQLERPTYEAAESFAARLASLIPGIEVPRLDAGSAPGRGE